MTLDAIAIKHSADKSSLYHNYADRYSTYLSRYVLSPIKMLEMGIQFGQSARMWLDYFSHAAFHLYGMDIADEGKLSDPRYTLFLCDQRNADTLPLPMLDVIIDDAGHYNVPMQAAFFHLWPKLKPGGIYALEDVAVFWDSLYDPSGPDGQQWLLRLVGAVNLSGKTYHGKPIPNPKPDLTIYEREIDFVHFYRGLVIIGKK
jgi:hypothetical protein